MASNISQSQQPGQLYSDALLDLLPLQLILTQLLAIIELDPEYVQSPHSKGRNEYKGVENRSTYRTPQGTLQTSRRIVLYRPYGSDGFDGD